MIRPVHVVAVLGGIALLTAVVPSIDHAGARLFYCRQAEQAWCHKDEQPWNALYHYGNYPGIAIGITGLALALYGFLRKHVRKRQIGIFLVVSLVVGPGLAVNGILKPLWGRPRPRNTIPFNPDGKPYRAALNPDFDGGGKSFPSGHVSTAFYTGALAWCTSAPGINVPLLTASLAYGFLMGITRMAQGGHFFSDAVWAAFITWSIMALCGRIFLKKGINSRHGRNPPL